MIKQDMVEPVLQYRMVSRVTFVLSIWVSSDLAQTRNTCRFSEFREPFLKHNTYTTFAIIFPATTRYFRAFIIKYSCKQRP